jgi:hypothetical protein
MPVVLTPVSDFMQKNIEKLQIFEDFDYINSKF